MELLTITLAAGETKQFHKGARYVEVIDASYPLDLVFYSEQGAMASDKATGALSGLFLEVEFGAFSMASANAQTVTLLLMENGRGGSRRQPGVVSVTNKIGSGIAQTFGAGAVAVGGNATPIVLPASNPRGLTVRSAVTSLTTTGSGNAELRFVAAPSVPALNYPANAYSFCTANVVGAGTMATKLEQQNFQLPAGWGVWVFTTNNQAVPLSAANWEFAYELA